MSRTIQVICALSVCAIFLLILPAIIAVGYVERTIINVSFVGTLFVGLWITLTELAYQSTAVALDFKKKSLFLSIDMHPFDKDDDTSGFRVMSLVSVSYLAMVYGFGLIYIFISDTYSGSFGEQAMSLVDGLYFSLVTASTVGYGDFSPKTDMAKLVVMAQVIINMIYMVFLFSSAVTYIQSNVKKP